MKNAIAAIAVVAFLVLALVPTASAEATADEVEIVLSDSGVTVDGSAASTDSASAVYVGAEIVYYESGTDSSYGEGTEDDMHDADEAAMHTVVTITQAGTYRISGTLSYGQIAVSVGSDEGDVVTLILDGVDITCTVAPAIIFYEVWESGDADTATTDIPDEAGANIVIADGSVNNVNGSHVARIYKEGTTSKLHKYDGAVYSKMSMIVSGESEGTGVLNITADNEGLDSELHLTINGGIINIEADNDGINTNEDGISVTEINGGTLYINAGLGSEGDGIDSNGYLVINGGTVFTMANPSSGDGGIDADLEILINGGTVVAIGSRNDGVSTSSSQAYMELTYASTQSAGTLICLTDADGNVLLVCQPLRAYQSVTISTASMSLGTTYHLYSGGTCSGTLEYGIYSGGSYSGGTQMQYAGSSSSTTTTPGATVPDGTTPGTTVPDSTVPGGTAPDAAPGGSTSPGGTTVPDGTTPGAMPTAVSSDVSASSGTSTEFTLTESSRAFTGITSSGTSYKTSVAISVEYETGDGTVSVSSIVFTADGAEVDMSGKVQVTVQDYPSESYYASATYLSDLDAVNALLPTDAGTYLITIAVLDSDSEHSGVYQAYIEIAEDGTVTVTEVDTGSSDGGDSDDGGSGGDGDTTVTTAGSGGSGNDSMLVYAVVAAVLIVAAIVAAYTVGRRKGSA